MDWIDTVRLRARALFRRQEWERELEDELRFHLEMQTEENIRCGMSPDEARRQAVILFGGVEGHKEEIRNARPLAWVGGLSLDLRLGLRMLAKYPGLALVGVVGMAVAIAIGAIAFEITGTMFRSTLPFPGGERVVALQLWDAEANRQERRILHDFATWREELRSIQDLGAWRPVERNLVVPGGPASPVTVAEMTASGFRLAHVPPLLGRTLVDEDEGDGAPPVALLGHDLWQTQFGGDPAVVGREVHLGDGVHTVVGVMPRGFGFPVNHGLWVPFRADPAGHGRREGPGIFVFGRLAPGAALAEAQAELATLGRRSAAAFPETHERLRPRLLPYTLEFLGDLEKSEARAVQLVVVLLLVVICVNVAILVYARTATRGGEIAVRRALGASRGRIVAQLFTEALVLSLGAAAVGLAAAGLVIWWLEEFTERQIGAFPFWMDLGLTPGTVLYVLGLSVLGAAIVGVAPALKATGGRLQSGLRELGGATGMRLGKTWTALIVAQIAVAVAVLPGATFGAWSQFRYGFARPGFAAEEFLTARIAMDRQPSPGGADSAAERQLAARYQDRLGELRKRLAAEPGVADVTFSSRPVGQEVPAQIEVDGVPAPVASPAGLAVRSNQVDAGFFGAFDIPVLAGRDFRAGDARAAAVPVLVNRAFVEQVLGGRNALGHRVRYVDRERAGGERPAREAAGPAPWHEIVGVVSDALTVGVDPGEAEARVYHPRPPGGLQAVSLAVRLRGGAPAKFAPRLREIATAVDPALQLHDMLPLDEALRQKQKLLRLIGLTIALVTLSVLLLSAAGIHALTSFTVARRRKEIGIRAALGARPHRLLANLFARVLVQLSIGLSLGIGAAFLLNRVVENLTGGQGAVVLPAAAALMLLVGLLAALGPARRGLRIQPMEALRDG